MPTKRGATGAHLFQPGQSGNPKGRKKGSLNKATAVIRTMAEKGGAEIMEAMIEKAKEGDVGAAKLVLDRTVVPYKATMPLVSLAGFNKKGATPRSQTALVNKAVANGDLPADLGATITSGLRVHQDLIDREEIYRRLDILEAAGGK